MAYIQAQSFLYPLARFLAAAFLLLAAGGSPALAQSLPKETVLRHFEQFALTTFGPQSEPAVVKWDAPGVVLLDGKGMTLSERQVVADVLSEIASTTGHDFRIARQGENATILLGFIQPFAAAIEGRYRDVFNKLFRDPLRHIELLVKASADGKANCLYRPAVNDFRVIGGLVLVKPGLPDAKLRKCLSVFLGKMAGLLGDARTADAKQGSAFDSDLAHNRFNALDREIMRLLYLKQLTPGMRREEALKIVKEHLR